MQGLGTIHSLPVFCTERRWARARYRTPSKTVLAGRVISCVDCLGTAFTVQVLLSLQACRRQRTHVVENLTSRGAIVRLTSLAVLTTEFLQYLTHQLAIFDHLRIKCGCALRRARCSVRARIARTPFSRRHMRAWWHARLELGGKLYWLR
jgi:hypothetical protein